MNIETTFTTMRSIIWICTILLFPAGVIQSQSFTNLIQNDDTYFDIVRKAETYFSDPDRKASKEYKHYQRWKGEVQYHVDASGSIRNFNAIQFQEISKFNRSLTRERATYGDWVDLGPFDYSGGDVYSGGGIGRLNCTAFHPTDPNTFWVGAASGGMWKTTDGGNTWEPFTDAFSSIGISGIVVHPADPDIIYILTGDGDGSITASGITRNSSIGVLKTTDGGLHWEATGLSFGLDELRYGYKLIEHPLDPDILFVAMRQMGIFRTQNGGGTWTQVDSNKTVWDIEFAPGNPSIMYAASNQGLLRSIDNGVSWDPENDPSFPAVNGPLDRMAIAVSPSQSANVYAVFGGSTGVNGVFKGVFKSTDYGLTFNMQSNTPNILASDMGGNNGTDQAWYDLCVLVDPLDDTRVFVGGVNLWKSEDSGSTWGRETWWTRNFEPLDPYVHADWHNIYFQGTTLYANVDGGIYKSDDYGNDWSELSAGLSIMQFYEVSVLENEYMGGSQDNGTNESSGGNLQFHNILGGDGFGCTWSPGNTAVKFLCTQDRLARREAGSNIFIWEEGNGFWRTDIKMHTTNNDYFFFDKGNELFRANQGAFIWEYNFDSLKTNSILGGNEILGFSQGNNLEDEIMYVVNASSIIKTTNLAAGDPTWTMLSNPVSGVTNLSDVVLDPANANEVWITCSGYVDTSKVYFSNNGGGSWMNITGSLPNVPVRCITVGTSANNGIYIGTDIGVFYRRDPMTDWIYFSNHLPNTRIVDIEISGGYVYAGSHGRGIWRSTIYSDCPSNLVLTQANDPSNPISIGEQHYSASNSITSSRIISGNEAQIYYSSGNYIDMLPGFLSQKNTFMEAKIGGCPD